MAKALTYSTTLTEAPANDGSIANSNDINSLAVTFANAHFASGATADVVGAPISNLVIDFADLAVVAAC